MKKTKWVYVPLAMAVLAFFLSAPAFAAYHHEGESDADNFLEVYPNKAGTKLDHCALCHCGGAYEKKGKMTTLGSCQWCHYAYGYDGSGNIADTLNPYGLDYLNAGRDADAVRAIEGVDSDGDTFSNLTEIEATRFPGDENDNPGQVLAPAKIYTRGQLLAMAQHSQFLLMNAARQIDNYVEYAGVIMEDLLTDAGMLPAATEITAYAPDGYAQVYPLDPMEGMYPVRWVYPESVYYYDAQADIAQNPGSGWCDYSAPSAVGYNNGDAIIVPGGLRMILALTREGQPLDVGVLNQDNKLDGEGPFRVVPPQVNPGEPDQSSNSANQDVTWPHDETKDHNAGASARTVTVIKVSPLPEGTTDIDIMEAGWNYVDQGKIVIYGAIDGSDSNGNGIYDTEEGTDENSDYNGDGTPDYRDPRTARFRHANGVETVLVDVSNGAIANMQALTSDDPALPAAGKPAHMGTPYGAFSYNITGLAIGETVTVTMVFPNPVPTDAVLYKITADGGWKQLAFGSNDGDNTITIPMTDGDPLTDGDGVANGSIFDPTALAVAEETAQASGSSSSSCFIQVAGRQMFKSLAIPAAIAAMAVLLIGGIVLYRRRL